MHVDLKSFVQCFITPWWISPMLSNVLIWYMLYVEEHNCMFCTYTDVNHVELCDIFMCPSVTFRLLPSGLYSGKFTYQGMLYELSVFVFVLFCLFDATGIETSFRKQKYYFCAIYNKEVRKIVCWLWTLFQRTNASHRLLLNFI